MDDDRSQGILENVDMVTHLPGQVVKLTSNNVIKDNEGHHEPPNDLINSQYINIHRVSDVALSKELVDCNSSGNTTLIGSDLLTHHVVHGNMVVDMMIRQSNTPNEFGQHTSLERALPQYIPVNESFETAEDILAHDLTEEDRSLAAALVAVQLVQQQKNNVTSESNVIVSPSHLSNLHAKVHEHHHISQMTPMSPSVEVKDETISQIGMVSTYMQTVDEGAVIVNHQEQHLLTPQQHHQTQPHTAHSQPHHNEDRILKMYSPIPSLTQLKKLTDYRSLSMKNKYIKTQIEEVENNLKDQNSYIKMENIGEELDEESEEGFQDDNDSDYDVENDLKTSRRSLPHKKRIPKKLKNPKKSTIMRMFRCTKCDESFPSQTSLATHKITAHTLKKSFGCELCGKNFINQLKFFEHLKSHYEPKPNQNVNILIKPNDKSDGCTEDMSDPIPPPPPPTTQVTQQISNETKNFNHFASLPLPISCHQCGKTFRRQKAYETHMNFSHPKEQINEFSDTEDMMEGIRVKVDSEEEPDHLIISSNEIRSIKSDKVWYPEQEMNIADNRISMQEANQPPSNNTPIESVTELVPVVGSNSSTTLTNGSTTETIKSMERQKTMTPSAPLDIKSENETPLADIMFSKAQYTTNSTTTTNNQVKRSNNGDHSGDLTSQDEESQETVSKKKVKKSRRTGLHLTCTQCGRVFHHRNSLVYHLRSHSGERPHTCEVCKKSFFAASALKVNFKI